DVGERTLAMAQRVLHQVAFLLAPDCVPLFLSDGYKEYLMAIVTILAAGFRCHAARPQGQPPNRAGGLCPSCSTPRSSTRCGGGGWSTCSTASCLARWRPSIRC